MLAAVSAYFGHGDWSTSLEDAHEISAWWIDPAKAKPGSWTPPDVGSVYSDAEIASLWNGQRQLILDAGAFGGMRGHSHAHSLNAVVRSGAHELLADPGVYTYTGEPEWRSFFRNTPMHNTVVVAGPD